MSFVHVEDLAEAYVLPPKKSVFPRRLKNGPWRGCSNLVDDQPITPEGMALGGRPRPRQAIPPSISDRGERQAGRRALDGIRDLLVRVKNDRAKSTLGWMLKYPTVRAGVPAAIEKNAIRKER